MSELPLTMPKMSMTMEEGTMVAWLKQEGDSVRSGEAICEIATDTADGEVESPFDGVLVRIIAQPDDVSAVGDTIAFITTDVGDLLGGLVDQPSGEAPAAVAAETVAPVAAPAPIATGWIPAVSASPVAAPVAVPVAAPAMTVNPVEARRLRTRKQVATVMSASALVPQFTAYVDLDLSALAAVRATTLGGASWTALFVRAQAIALAENAALNGTWTDGGVTANEHIGIALAIDSPSGLIAPVLTNSHEGTLAELVAEIATVVDETRNGTLPPARLGGGTSVFSNLGGFGVESFNALLTPPQSTALSSGAVKPRMRVFDDETFGVRLSCTIGLTVDHRVADGADAARMLATITNLVATPERLL